MSTKQYLDINCCDAARERFRMIFREFERVCVSFSNGKDSGLLLNMAIDAAREAGKLPVHAMYIDMEAQYRHAIEFTHRMFSRPEVTGWWICLPIHLRNAVSQIQPYWIPWEQSKRDAWVREYPDDPHVVKDTGYFPFFRYGMEFEEFVPEFVMRYVFESAIEKELVNTFRTTYEGPFLPDREEIDEGRFWSCEEIEEALGNGLFTPNFEGEYNKLKAFKQ